MLLSLALIFLVGMALGELFERLKLPRLLGMLLTGALLGPCALDWIDGSVLAISADVRKIALIVILVKAGLALNVSDLKRVGRPALLLAFLPASFEIAACVALAPLLLGLTTVESAVLGAVLGAVSPAVVVPKMVQLMEQGYGVKQGVPQMILAGASLDDVFVIVLFTSFTGLAQGGAVGVWSFAEIPLSIVSGLAVGALLGAALAWLFGRVHLRDTVKVVLLLALAMLLTAVEDALALPFSGLLACMSMALALRRKREPVARRLSVKFSKLWVAAEIALFVLVGAAVDLPSVTRGGASILLLIALALLVRSVGTWLCTLGTSLTRKERAFCVVSYWPKATVQAAIGSVPLSMGLACGQTVLSAAVVAILVTAPLGAIAMDAAAKHWLSR